MCFKERPDLVEHGYNATERVCTYSTLKIRKPDVLRGGAACPLSDFYQWLRHGRVASGAQVCCHRGGKALDSSSEYCAARRENLSWPSMVSQNINT